MTDNDITHSGPPTHSTPEGAEKYQAKVDEVRDKAIGRWTIAPDCTVTTACGKKHAGDLIGKGEIPLPLLRHLISRGTILELSADEVQRRADLKRATHVVGTPRGMVLNGEHKAPGDPIFPEDFKIKRRAAYSYADKDGTIREVPERVSQDGSKRFEDLIDAGRLVPNLAFIAKKQRRAS